MSTLAEQVPDAAGLIASLAAHDYLAESGLATALFCAVRLPQPLLLEGEAGVGKTQAAKSLAEMLNTPLIRLQCFEGIDALRSVNRKKRPKAPVDIRFHLHPDVDARRTVDGGAVELTLPGGAMWRFESTHGVNVEESIYLGERGHVRSTRQLVVSSTTGAQRLQINWRLLKV